MPTFIEGGRYMFNLHCERTIACSHQLEFHKGKCQNLHGHNFKVIVDVEATALISEGSSMGMVMDFGDIKEIIDTFDHTHLNTTLSGCKQPTAEFLSYILASRIYNRTGNDAVTKVTVRVYETDTQYAEYTHMEV